MSFKEKEEEIEKSGNKRHLLYAILKATIFFILLLHKFSSSYLKIDSQIICLINIPNPALFFVGYQTSELSQVIE